MKQIVLSLIVIFSFLAAETELGQPIRQGKHIEWFRGGDFGDPGEVIAIWSDTRNGDRDVICQKIDDTGNFLWGDDGIVIVDFEGRQEDPVGISDGSGGVIVAWVDYHDDEKGDIYAQRIDDAGNLLWNASGVPIAVLDEEQKSIRVCKDNAGGAVIVWVDKREGGGAGKLYGSRILSDGTIAPGWEGNVKISTGSSGQNMPSVDYNGDGGCFVAWHEDRSTGSDDDIYLQQILGNGSLAFESDGLLISGSGSTGDPSEQTSAKLIPDEQDGVILIWADKSSGNFDIKADRISASGNKMWKGMTVTDAVNNQQDYRIAQDGLGGAVIVWEDYRNDPINSDLFVQRINQWGVLGWGTDGLLVCGASGNQIEPRINGDGNGGAFIVWMDERNGSFPEDDIYYAHIDQSGSNLTTADGDLISDENSWQFSPLVRHDQNGGAFFIWGDQKDGSIDLMAQHVNTSDITSFQDNGLQFMTGLGGDAKSMNLLSDGENIWWAWEDHRKGLLGTQTFIQRMNSENLSFTENGIPVITTAGLEQISPNASVADDFLFFAHEETSNDPQQIIAQGVSSSGNPQWQSDGLSVFPSSENQENVQTVWLGEFGYIAWSEDDGNGLSVLLQKINQNGATQWGSPLAVSNATGAEDGDEWARDMQTDDAGNVFILWERQYFDYEIFDIVKELYIQGVDPQGNLIHAEGNVQISQVGTDCFNGRMKIFGDQIWIVWLDKRNDNVDIYAKKLNQNLTTTINEFPIVVAANDQSGINIDIAPTGELVIVWHDFRTGSSLDVYCQILTSGGANYWENGEPICTENYDQQDPFVLATSEGIIIAWEDYRLDGVYSDLYFQFLNFEGEILGLAQGEVLCDAGFKQKKVQIVTAGENYIFSWQDMRSSGKTELSDIYFTVLSNFVPFELGDINGDGSVNVLDVLRLVAFILGTDEPTSTEFLAGDWNGDGNLNVMDVLGLVNFILNG